MVHLSGRSARCSLGGAVSGLALLAMAFAMVVGVPASAVAAPAPNPRGVKVVAGIHDTAVNDCNGGGTLQLKAPSVSLLTSKQVAAAGASVNSRLFPRGVSTVRVTMPWDVADPGVVDGSVSADKTKDKQTLNGTRACLDAWLKAVFAHHLQPEIDFRSDTNFANANHQVRMPTMQRYTRAMTAFRNAYITCASRCADGGQVRVIAPWNEPDNQGGNKIGSTYDVLLPDGHTHLAGKICPANPTAANCGAVRAAQMWVTDYQVVVQGGCPGCLVVAGDFSGGYGFLGIHGGACPKGCKYLFLYNKNLVTSAGQRLQPTRWAVHPYFDTENFQAGTPKNPTRLSDFANKLHLYGYRKGTFIWLNEVSVCDTPGPATCAKKIVNGKVAAMRYLVGSAGTDLTMSVSPNGPQVGRIDYYCFSGAQRACSPDWALVNNGTVSPAGHTYFNWANG
ncbi:MAG: hypothetical protein J2P15_13900 [Micromonosporaceae bacterium]|nr:hypothetical protein [Micromonosporaceae bacterium]